MSSDKITVPQILFPLSLISFVFVVFLAFQTSILVNDRQSLDQSHTQQDKPLEQVDKIKAQVNALAVGTLKLSKQGDKNAVEIIAQLKKAGITVADQPPAATSAAPGMTAPAAPVSQP